MYYVGLHIGATWQMRLNRLYAAAMQPFCQITLTIIIIIITSCNTNNVKEKCYEQTQNSKKTFE